MNPITKNSKDDHQVDDCESAESYDTDHQQQQQQRRLASSPSIGSTETGTSDSEDEDDDDDVTSAMAVAVAVAVGNNNSCINSLPLSPPLNRTPISKVKERDRSRSSSRSRHRSLSPPPQSPPPPPAVATLPVATPVPVSAAASVSFASTASSHLQSRLEAAKSEITKLLTERRDQEKEAKQQTLLMGQRLQEKEQHVCHLMVSLDAARSDSQRQIQEFRFVLHQFSSQTRS